MKQNIANFLATWFYSGYINPAPGTWGSIAAIPFGIALLYTGSLTVLISATAIIFALGLWSAHMFSAQSGVHDDKRIVIDEVVGQWIAFIPLCGLSINPLLITIAFIAFRFFDILKPWPICIIDKKVPGAYGVMMDDVFAGIAAAVVVMGAQHYVL